MCDIWRVPPVQEITTRDLERHLGSLRALGVRWVVLSGGEPLMHSELAAFCRQLRTEGMRITLLTAGLLLAPQARAVAENIDDVIVSLDGPPEIHDQIRNVPRAFARLAEGITAIRELRPEIRVSGRTTVQKLNHQSLRATVQTAKQLRLDSVSFLAADVNSQAFNRPGGWTPERQKSVALAPEEVERLDQEIAALNQDYSEDINRGFVAEGPEKLRRIALHFRAQLDQVTARAPRCNAPWVSAVIEADGTVRPCFFHRSIGNIHERLLLDILNSAEAIEFRSRLDVTRNPICQTCVCPLHFVEGKGAKP